MANITELQFQGDSTVHKLNDARITSTPIANPTHILGSKNANLTSIAPITIANLASVIGVPRSDDELLVDLGLPSGNLWATRNVDVTRQNGFAASPYQYECSFFSWGNTFGVNPISSSAFSYDWGTGNDGPYASTPGASLKADVGLSDDFGRLNLGGEWRLPTINDFAELLNSSYTKYVDANGDVVTGTNKLVTVNGVVGIRLMSLINGKTIFFPCSGYGNGTSWNYRGASGNYWSSSLDSATQCRDLNFNSGGVHPQNYYPRFYGFACRPVSSKSYKDVYPTLSGLASALGATRESQELIVDLGLPSGRKWATHNIDVTMQNGFTKSIYQYECSFFSCGNTFGVNPISSSAFSYDWGAGNDGPYASTPGASLTGNAGLGYDSAFANLGNSWRLPTTEDFVELFNSSNTKYVDASGTEIADATNKLTIINGIRGICLMSKANGKTIFFPCSGYGSGTSWYDRGSYGNYWSSSLLSSTHCRSLAFGSRGVYPQGSNSRSGGFAVRPVQ